MPGNRFVSYAPQRQDVVLWRALHAVPEGRFVELRPGPDAGLAVRALTERGWTGTVATADDAPDLTAVLGASGPVHVLVVGPDDAARAVLREVPAAADRPWVVVVDSRPDEDPWEPTAAEQPLLGAGYACVLRDGLSRFLLAPEHADLAPALRLPAHPRDGFVDAAHRTREDEVRYWRGRAVESWSAWEPPPASFVPPEVRRALADAERAEQEARAELDRMTRTLSWRVTRPLRMVRRLGAR